MNDTTLSIGFIGGGVNSAVGNTHRIAAQADHRWRIEAGCFSRHDEINRATASLWGIDPARLYGDWRAFLEHERGSLDAVCILTPTDLHAEMILEALRLGYAVICEKAMAASAEEAARIRDYVEAEKGFLAVTYNYSGYPMLRELREMIREGKLGKVFQVQVEMPQEGFARLDARGERPRPQEWRLRDGVVPTVSLDLGVHLHHVIRFITGEAPVEVVALQESFGFFSQVVDDVSCIARYTGGLKCQIWYGKSAIGHRNGLRVRVYGEKGGAEWYQLQPEEILFSDREGDRRVIDRASKVSLAGEPRYNRFKSGHPAGFIEAFANLYYDIADACVEYKAVGSHSVPWVYGAGQSLEGMLLLEAIAESSRTRRWVPVNAGGRERE